MGFVFRRSFRLGKGVYLNASKSGLSTSVRTKAGSVGSRGFSFRTGIPGLSFRSRGKNSGVVGLIILLLVGAVYLAYWFCLLVFWTGYFAVTSIVWIVGTIADYISYRRDLKKAGSAPEVSIERGTGHDSRYSENEGGSE